mmetsp:Transcript_31451/g.53204  ORF Transcript_31451/g.53204 Transcript_31451/m.53204 type:complete len:150 (-) Transcript_31451:135-584(-)
MTSRMISELDVIIEEESKHSDQMGNIQRKILEPLQKQGYNVGRHPKIIMLSNTLELIQKLHCGYYKSLQALASMGRRKKRHQLEKLLIRIVGIFIKYTPMYSLFARYSRLTFEAAKVLHQTSQNDYHLEMFIRAALCFGKEKKKKKNSR